MLHLHWELKRGDWTTLLLFLDDIVRMLFVFLPGLAMPSGLQSSDLRGVRKSLPILFSCLDWQRMFCYFSVLFCFKFGSWAQLICFTVTPWQCTTSSTAKCPCSLFLFYVWKYFFIFYAKDMHSELWVSFNCYGWMGRIDVSVKYLFI